MPSRRADGAPSRGFADGRKSDGVTRVAAKQESVSPSRSSSDYKETYAEGVTVLIDKWVDKQDLFEEYVVKPACIHVLVNNHVKRINVWTGAFKDPAPIVKTEVNACFVVKAASPAEPKLSESSSSGAGSSGDWGMLEKGRGSC